MDKETNNLMAFASYKEQKQMNHLSRARSDFYADVIYEDDGLDTITLNKLQLSGNIVTTMTSPSKPSNLHTMEISTSVSKTSSSRMAVW